MKIASNYGAEHSKRFAMPQWFQIAAALAVGVGIGFAGDAALHKETSNDWRQAIATYQSLSPKETPGEKVLDEPPYVKEGDENSVEVRSYSQGRDILTGRASSLEREKSKIATVSAKLGLPIKPEALQVPHLEFKSAQLMQFENRPLARFAYLDAKGNPITFSIFHTAETDKAPRPAKYERLDALSWNKGGYGFLIIGTAPIEELRRATLALASQVQVN